MSVANNNMHASMPMSKFISPYYCLRYRDIREGIIRCILATDMARHNEILTQFQEVTPVFDYSNEAHINLVNILNVSFFVHCVESK